MIKNLYDIGSVWAVTLIANIGAPILITLPVIREVATIISVLLAIAFTIYRFYKEIKKNKNKKK